MVARLLDAVRRHPLATEIRSSRTDIHLPSNPALASAKWGRRGGFRPCRVVSSAESTRIDVQEYCQCARPIRRNRNTNGDHI